MPKSTPPADPSRPPVTSVAMIVLASLSLVWLALALPIYSHPDTDGMAATLHAAPALLLIAPAWLVAAIALVAWSFRNGPPKNRARLTGVALLTPACGLLGVILLATDHDMRLRFRLSESQLAREADRVRNSPDGRDNRTRRVGLYRVHHAHTDANGAVHLVTNNTHLFGEAGFIHAPDAPPERDPISRDQHLTHLRGPWHAYFIVD